MHVPQRREFLIGTLIILVALSVVGYWCLPDTLFPAIFAPGWDNWFYTGPCVVFMDAAIQQGEIPLWNPLSFCGTPFAAHPESAVFYPLNLLRSVLLQSPTPFTSLLSLVGLSVFHIVLAGVGSFLLARAHGVSRAGASVASFVFMLNPTFLRWALELWQYSVCIAWTPVLMLLMKQALDAENRRTVISLSVVSALILGAGITAGFPQFFIHLCVALFTYGCCYAAFSLSPKQRDRVRVSIALLMPFVIAPFLAAVFLVPAVEYAQFIGRGGVEDLAASNLFVDRSPLSLLKHFLLFDSDPGLEGRRVAGAGVLLLCIGGLFSRYRKREKCLWGFMALVMLDCCIGRPMPIATLIDVVTQSQMRLPSRLMPFFCLPLGMLAGMGVDALQRHRLRIKRFPALRNWVLSALFIMAIVLLHHWVNELEWLSVSRMVVWIPAALAVGVIVMPYASKSVSWRPLFPLLIFLELLIWNHDYLNALYSRVDLKGFGVTSESLKAPAEFWDNNYRGAEQFPNAHMTALNPSITGFDPLYIENVHRVLSGRGNEGVYSHWLKAPEVTEENHRGHLLAKRSFWLAREYAVGSLPEKDQLFPPTTTAFLSEPHALSVPQVEPEEVSSYSVSENLRSVPLLDMDIEGYENRIYYTLGFDETIPRDNHATLVLVFSAGRGRVMTRFIGEGTSEIMNGFTHSLNVKEESDEAQILEVPLPSMDVQSVELMIQTNSDNTFMVILENAVISIDQGDENHLINVLDRSANEVSVEIGPLEGPRILTFVDAMYPGWVATIDGEVTPIFASQEVFKGIEVPPGKHLIEFTYRPMSYRIGKWISLLTLFSMGIVLLLSRKKREA